MCGQEWAWGSAVNAHASCREHLHNMGSSGNEGYARVSLWDELSHTDVNETQTALWLVYSGTDMQRHSQGQLQDEDVQSVTIARGSPEPYWVQQGNFLSRALLVTRTRQAHLRWPAYKL